MLKAYETPSLELFETLCLAAMTSVNPVSGELELPGGSLLGGQTGTNEE